MEEGGSTDVPLAAEQGVARVSLSSCPLRCSERHCPFVQRWLEALGCEEALIVRDITHLSLYFSCILSLFITAFWGADVCSGDCLIPRPWYNGTVDRYRCIYEILGVCVFVGTLMDSVQMIGHYDNDHQVLLRRKCQLMEEARQEALDALRSAEENANKLTQMLLKGYETRVRDHIDEYFSNVWPVLFHGLDLQTGPDLELLEALNGLVGQNLNEIGELAVAHHSRLAALSHQLPNLSADCRMRLTPPAVRRPFFWLLLLNPRPPNTGIPSSPSTSSGQTQTASNADIGIDNGIVRDPGEFVFGPVKEMVRFVADSLSGDYIQAVQRSTNELHYQQEESSLCGCGRRAAGVDDRRRPRRCACCCPRLLAHILRCLLCSYCCCCCRNRGNCCAEALVEYPKYWAVGCFWVKIISRLHERLIQGLVLTITFCVVYAFSEWRILFSIGENLSEEELWNCVWDLVRRALIMLALLCHIPALFLCLTRIRDLEAIVRITEDIVKIRGIRRVVRELERSVAVDLQRQGLLEALEDRVLARARLLHQHRLLVLKPTVRSKRGALRAATEELVQSLRSVNEDLKSATDWVELPVSARRTLADKTKEFVEQAGKRLAQRVEQAL